MKISNRTLLALVEVCAAMNAFYIVIVELGMVEYIKPEMCSPVANDILNVVLEQ